MKNKQSPDLLPETLLAHAGAGLEDPSGGVVPGIYPATTFVRDEHYGLRQDAYSYSRTGMPNWSPVEQLMTKLEGGADSQLFASGLAAATTVVQALKPGDGMVMPDIMYHGMRDWVADFCGHWGLQLSTYRVGDPDSLRQRVETGSTRLVWVETPANPSWEITDIAACSEIAHKAGAICVVDSTVATPLITRPISLGADLVVHSATKYLNGHSDVLGGIVVTAEKNELWERICELRGSQGAVMGPFEAWLLLRGLRTLDVRMRRATANAMAIAEALQGHEKIEKVLYPGLPDHPGHKIAMQQMNNGFGAMMSLLVKGDGENARRIAASTRVFRPATSLGGVESLIEHRASVESADSPVAQNLLRLSVGIEAAEDLIGDLIQALNLDTESAL